jgi:hypothetical protein
VVCSCTSRDACAADDHVLNSKTAAHQTRPTSAHSLLLHRNERESCAGHCPPQGASQRSARAMPHRALRQAACIRAQSPQLLPIAPSHQRQLPDCAAAATDAAARHRDRHPNRPPSAAAAPPTPRARARHCAACHCVHLFSIFLPFVDTRVLI